MIIVVAMIMSPSSSWIGDDHHRAPPPPAGCEFAHAPSARARNSLFSECALISFFDAFNLIGAQRCELAFLRAP